MRLFRYPVLCARVDDIVLNTLPYPHCSSACINVHHELGVRFWYDFDIALDCESIVELTGRFGSTMLDVANLCVDSNLDPRVLLFLFSRSWFVGFARDDWGIRVNDSSCLIENTADRDGVLEGRGIERNEGRTAMGKTGGGAESELEGLFEEEATKDHEVVSVSVLWLHDGGSGQTSLLHLEDVVGLAHRIGGVMVLQLLLPHGVNEV